MYQRLLVSIRVQCHRIWVLQEVFDDKNKYFNLYMFIIDGAGALEFSRYIERKV